MKQWNRWIIVAVCSLTMGVPLVAASAGVKGRQVNQQKRIRHGVAAGELTRPEAVRLEKRAARIHRSVVRDRADQGVFTPRERIKSQKKLSAQSRAIYNQKRDGDRRD